MGKIIFIISATLFLLLCGALAVQHFLFNGKSDGSAQNTPSEGAAAQLPSGTGSQPNQSGQLIKLVDGSVQGLALASDGGKLMYYQNGNFLTVALDGSNRNSIGAYPFRDIVDIKWSGDKKRAIVWTKEGFYVYNLDSDQVVKLKEGIDIAAWGPGKDQILYKFFDSQSKTRSIHIASLSSDTDEKLKNIDYRKVDFILHPTSGELNYYPTADSFSEGELTSLRTDGSGEKRVFGGKFGADFLWSPNGKKLLVSFVSEKGGNKMELGSTNASGGEQKTYAFSTTVKKCVWSNDNVTVYCAGFGVEGGLDDSYVLPNDWNSKKLDQGDTFWRINTEDGKKTRIIEISKITEKVDGENYILDPDEKYLFFIDRKKGGLYRLEL